jgi:hypothetical protein
LTISCVQAFDDGPVYHLDIVHVGVLFVAGDAEHVHVPDGGAHDGALALVVLKGEELLLYLLGFFELHALGVVRHQLLEMPFHRAEIAPQHVLYLLDFVVVRCFRFEALAGALAVLDMVFEADLELATSNVLLRQTEVAGAQWEQLFYQIQNGFHPKLGSIWPEVRGAIPNDPAGEEDPWKPLILDAEVGIALAVFQHHVVRWLEALDERAFEQQGVGLGVHQCHFDAVGVLHHDTGLEGHVLGVGEVAGEAVFEVFGLADI